MTASDHAARVARPDVRHSRAAARMKAYRQREAAGRVVLTIEVPLIEVAELLIGGKLLQPHHANDRDELARAVERLLAMLIHAELLGAEGG
jgi:hypothetical protein